MEYKFKRKKIKSLNFNDTKYFNLKYSFDDRFFDW